MVARPHPGEVLEVLRADLALFDVAFRQILDSVIKQKLDALGDAVGLVLAVFEHGEDVCDERRERSGANFGDDYLIHGFMRLW